MCSRTIRRAELAGHLNPSVLHREFVYRREEIEQALEESRLRPAPPISRNAPPQAMRSLDSGKKDYDKKEQTTDAPCR